MARFTAVAKIEPAAAPAGRPPTGPGHDRTYLRLAASEIRKAVVQANARAAVAGETEGGQMTDDKGREVIFRENGKYVAGPDGERVEVTVVGGASLINLGESKTEIFDLKPNEEVPVTVGRGGDGAPDGYVKIRRLR